MNYRDEFNNVGKDVKWTVGKILKIVIPLIVVIFVVSFAVNIFIVQPSRLVSKTMDADNVIFNYEWFYDRYEGIKAVDKKIKIAEGSLVIFKKDAGERKDWTFEDKTEHSRLNSIVMGQKNIREEFVAEYNANAQKFNRKIFKSKNLPDRIE